MLHIFLIHFTKIWFYVTPPLQHCIYKDLIFRRRVTEDVQPEKHLHLLQQQQRIVENQQTGQMASILQIQSLIHQPLLKGRAACFRVYIKES